MARNLTRPQELLMVKAMRHGDAPVCGARYRVAANLSALGFGELVADVFTPTRAGLEALLYDRKMKDWRYGSMASMKDVEEVECTLKGFER